MFSKTAAIIRDNWWFYIFLVAMMTVIVGAQDAGYLKSGGGIGLSVLWLLLARFAHRSALLGRRFGDKNADGTADKSFGGFLIKGLVLGIAAAVLALPVLFLTSDMSNAGGIDGSGYLAFLSALIITYSAVLGLLGSWLPASIHGENKGIRSAFRRGMSNFIPVFIRILVLMVITMSITFGAILIFMGLAIPTSVVADGRINIAATLLTVLLLAVQCINVTLSSVILSHYYRDYEERVAGMVFPG